MIFARFMIQLHQNTEFKNFPIDFNISIKKSMVTEKIFILTSKIKSKITEY